jgi:hypothetical protein
MNLVDKLKKDSKLLFLLLLIFAVLLLILFAIFVGFALWFWILLVIFVLYLFCFSILFKKFGCLISFLIYLVFALFVIFYICLGGSDKSKSESGSSVSTESTKLSADECKTLYDKYNNKVLKISGDSTVGSIGIKLTTDCKLSARYIITFTGALPENPIPSLAVSNYYNYVNNLHKDSETARGHYGVGSLSPVTQNALKLPDPFSSSQVVAEFYRDQTNVGTVPKTSSFYWSYEKIGDFTQAKYQEMLDNNVFEVVDGLPYMETTALAGGGNSYSIDQEKAEQEGTIVKSIRLTITE